MISTAFHIVTLGMVVIAVCYASYWLGYHDGHADGGELEQRRLRGLND